MSDYRERSRSPHHSLNVCKYERGHRHRSRQQNRHSRSLSPYNDTRPRRHHRRHHDDKVIDTAQPPAVLPLKAPSLSKHELGTYRPLFTLYLDIQKQLDIDDLPEEEVRGRWKSFVKKWNTGDLAEGWYDPKTFEKAKRGTFGMSANDHSGAVSKASDTRTSARQQGKDKSGDEDGEDDDFGPSLPPTVLDTSLSHGTSTMVGPAIPSSSDLRLRHEQAREDADTLRSAEQKHLRSERQAEYKNQTAQLDDLVPRAEAGTRERQLEKKQEVAASNRAFAAARDAGGDVELRDADVMGGEDSLGELKRMRETEQRKRTEREIRREEILRTRAAERDERVKGLKEKEAKTMEMLKSIAKARFGGGEGHDAE